MFRTFVGFVMISTAVVLPATADMAGRNLLLTPQVAIPIGSLRELAGGGAGVGVDWLRPIDAELTFVASTAMLGFIRKTDPGVLHAAEGLLGLDETYTVDHEFEVVAVPFLVGIKYRSEELFASLRLGDLLTRIDERTALYTNGTRRDAGFSSKAEHGVLLSVSAGVERNDLPFAGVHLYFAPGSRGLRGQSHLTWLSVFVSL